MDVLKKIKAQTWTIIILVLYIIFLQECNDKQFETDVESSTGIDTVFTRTIDSIYVLDTVYLTVRSISYDTIYVDNDTLGRYENEVEDEMLKGTIVSYVDGILINQDFQYVAKFPQYIHTIDTVKLIDRRPYIRFWAGGELGGNYNTFNISPIVGWTNRKGNSYYYRYGLVNKTHNIGITRTLYKY
jgi:hypothetical protein